MINPCLAVAVALSLTPLLGFAQNTADKPPPAPQILGEPVPPPPAPVQPPPPTVPLGEWIESMKARMPEHICQDQGEWLACFSLEPSNCGQTAMEIGNLCLEILAQNMPADLTEEQAGHWGVEAARCFNLTFFNLHREKLSDEEECQEPPPHLR